MSDQFTYRFFTWVDQNGVDKKKIATELKNTEKTLANWSSRGIPDSKRFACQALMDRHAATQIDPNSTHRVAIEYTDTEYDTITDAAGIVGDNARKFMHRAVVARARQVIKEQTLGLVADEQTAYDPTSKAIEANKENGGEANTA